MAGEHIFYGPIDISTTSDTGLPPPNFLRLKHKPDGKLYLQKSTGVEQVIEQTTVTQLLVDGGQANTTFNQFLLRLDFGSGGANINPTGNPNP